MKIEFKAGSKVTIQDNVIEIEEVGKWTNSITETVSHPEQMVNKEFWNLLDDKKSINTRDILNEVLPLLQDNQLSKVPDLMALTKKVPIISGIYDLKSLVPKVAKIFKKDKKETEVVLNEGKTTHEFENKYITFRHLLPKDDDKYVFLNCDQFLSDFKVIKDDMIITKDRKNIYFDYDLDLIKDWKEIDVSGKMLCSNFGAIVNDKYVVTYEWGRRDTKQRDRRAFAAKDGHISQFSGDIKEGWEPKDNDFIQFFIAGCCRDGRIGTQEIILSEAKKWMEF